MRTLVTAAAMVCAFSALSGPATAQIEFADVGKNLENQQTGPTTVVPLNAGVNGFFFARTFYNTPGDFDGGSMSWSSPLSPAPYNLEGVLDASGQVGGGYQSGYLTPAQMDADYPTGDTFTLTATNSMTSASQTVQVAYSADVYTADTPALTAASWTLLQSIDPSVTNAIDFDDFTPAVGATGLTYFTVYDYTTGSYVVNDAALASSTTGVSIGAGTFAAGDSYVWELIFDDAVGESYGGVSELYRSDVRTLGYFSVPGSVPEPEAWVLLLLGVTATGSALRASRHRIRRA